MTANNVYTNPLRELNNGAVYPSGSSGDRQIRSIIETFEILSSEGANFVQRIVSLPSTARILGIETSNDAITAATVNHIGVYRTRKDGGTVLSNNCLANSISFATAQRQVNALTQPVIENIVLPLWQIAGLSADPSGELDIAILKTIASTVNGTVTIRIDYQ